jgi:hypothetical protein
MCTALESSLTVGLLNSLFLTQYVEQHTRVGLKWPMDWRGRRKNQKRSKKKLSQDNRSLALNSNPRPSELVAQVLTPQPRYVSLKPSAEILTTHALTATGKPSSASIGVLAYSLQYTQRGRDITFLHV